LHSFDEKTDRTFVAFNGTDRIISASNAPSQVYLRYRFEFLLTFVFFFFPSVIWLHIPNEPQGRINRNEVRIWDVNEGAVLFSLTGNNGGVSSFASNQTCILFRHF
jgi:hypothetical protein